MAAEKHYTPSELAEMWGVSVQTIRDLFKKEDGVPQDWQRWRAEPESVQDASHPLLRCGARSHAAFMLNLYRRHLKKCANDSRDNLSCQCPIWMDWTQGSTRLQKSLGIRDWQASQRRARDMKADGIDAYLTGDSGTLTVQKASDAFEADAKNNIQESTLKQYRLLLPVRTRTANSTATSSFVNSASCKLGSSGIHGRLAGLELLVSTSND